jgi:SagB-type dehydrogenase family enzyme
MTNRDTEATWNYHNSTKHSEWSVRADTHRLDWANEPLPFKVYPSPDLLPLPREVPQTGIAALSALAHPAVTPDVEAVPDLNALAQILFFSAGITRRRKYPGGEIFFRAAACTGALYEIELYLVCGDLPGLPAGVYHFDVGQFGLRQLRAGDFRALLARATGSEPAVAHAPVTLICTGVYWRNAWKYQDRTYRHFGWDNGTILANLLAVCTARQLPARVVSGFVDAEVNRLLDLDTEREVAFSVVPVGYRKSLPPEVPAEPSPLGLEVVPYSRREVNYPAMGEMHDASSLHSPEEVATWRGPTPALELPLPAGAAVQLEPLGEDETPRDPIEQVILRRGSTRRFARQPVTLAQLSALLECASGELAADFLVPPGAHLNHLYLIVNAVEGAPPGAYLFHRERGLLECLREGEFRSQAYRLGLEQELPGDASVAVFFLADLRPILTRFGNRGYRAAQLEAGIRGGRLYLAAYAQRLGATGLTFYDDEVTEFFSPHAEGKSAIFLMALGKSVKRRRR